jgi:methanogenic corrinoid protein MtbC1
MKSYFAEFMMHFNQNDKDACVEYALKGLKQQWFSIPKLYEDLLRPALYTIDECVPDDPNCIWQEHVKTAIVKTIIESVYPFVIAEKKMIQPLDITVLLTAPEKEYHEIGLRMMSDFFALCGYHPIYIGINTPRDQVCHAIQQSNPKYVAIGVTDYYLIVEAKKMIAQIRLMPSQSIKIILGGSAFFNNPHAVSEVGGDRYFSSFRDIQNLSKEDRYEISL